VLLFSDIIELVDFLARNSLASITGVLRPPPLRDTDADPSESSFDFTPSSESESALFFCV
jgi:hypothetical protein